MVGGTVARSTARMLERRDITRAGMSRISVLAAVGASIWFSRADPVGSLVGSAFLGAVLCCDAVRARMRANRRDALTLWLVAMLSQIREYVVYLGLAVGAVMAGVGGAWGWSAGALVALALRDSLLVARSAPTAPVPERDVKGTVLSSPGRTGDLLEGLMSRPPREPRVADPGLTGRLSGTPANGARSGRGSGGAPKTGPVNGAVHRQRTTASEGLRADDGGSGTNGFHGFRAARSIGELKEIAGARNDIGTDTDGSGTRTGTRSGDVASGAGGHAAAPATPATPTAPATPTPRGEAGADTGVLVRAATLLPALARRLMVFSQPTRFLVIAVTATFWDARVAFITLIVGCAVAVTGELVDPAGHGERR